MKRIIIVNNNMKVGGVQKSLYNLLWAIYEDYDITLCLFHKKGAYMDNLPTSVKVIEVSGLYHLLGMSQRECTGFNFFKRAMIALLCRVFGRKLVLSYFKCNQSELNQTYDCAISFLHNGRPKSSYGGVQDFVLNCVKAEKKIAFLHGDYRNCGSNNTPNNFQLAQFDRVAACSEGCRQALLSCLPHFAEKCVTVRNCHNFGEIYRLSEQDTVVYDKSFINIMIVARLSREKGIDRAINSVAHAKKSEVAMKLHIVGDGIEREYLCQLAEQLDLQDSVIFYGEQNNPYRFMKNADLLLISSYHEAAPMVIDEACCLGLPILTTATTSATEMITERSCGWVCVNTQEALDDTLLRIVSHKNMIQECKIAIQKQEFTNDVPTSQWRNVIDH